MLRLIAFLYKAILFLISFELMSHISSSLVTLHSCCSCSHSGVLSLRAALRETFQTVVG